MANLNSIAVIATAVLASIGGCSCARATKPATPASTAVQPPAAAPTALPAAAVATGTVLETMDAASYTYVRVKTSSGEIWAATGQFKVAVGDKVAVPLEMPMENFHSNTLKRDFKTIYFATRIERQDGPAAK